jgi:hypothetical protein
MWQILKKKICVFMLFFCSFSAVYAENSKNITLCIQGSGGQPNFVQGFKEALIIEAKAAGYNVTENLSAAKYSIKFSVDLDQTQEKSKFIVSLVKVSDSSVIVSMEYLFADEEEMLLYSQLVFFMLMANLPDNETSEAVDNNWRDKWVYINPYFNYSLMFLALKSDGLIGDSGIYNDSVDPWLVSPIDNKISPMPGVGLGLEFQFLPFMSIEPGFLISREEAVFEGLMWNMLASVRVKFPLKIFRNVMLEPYGIAAYPLRFPKENEPFATYPLYVYGGGMQIAAKAGKNGALFVDVNYLYYGDTSLYNQFDKLYPKPETIHYNHSVLSFGVGYKIGLFNRKRSNR